MFEVVKGSRIRLQKNCYAPIYARNDQLHRDVKRNEEREGKGKRVIEEEYLQGNMNNVSINTSAQKLSNC